MADLDFPASPTVGQKYPVTPVVGQPQYAWDGEKWSQITAAATYVAKAGDTMTGHLSLPTAPAAANAVRKDYVDGAITSAITAYAAPLDALAYNGMQINGSFEVSQGRGSTPVATTPGVNFLGYVADGWQGYAVMPTGQVVFGRADLAATFPGYIECFQFTPAIVQATLGANDYVRFIHLIEGYRFSRVKWGVPSAVPVTVGFWARASLAGNYRALIHNHDGSSVTPWATFALAGGAAFQWVTITFAGVTTGTWKTDNSKAAVLAFEMASPATPNLMASTSNYATITGVVVLPGIYAPTAAQSTLLMRPYDQELLTCKRYWESGGTMFLQYAAAGQYLATMVPFTVSKRSSPTIAISTVAGGANTSSVTADSANPGAFRLVAQAISAGAVEVRQNWTADARL